MVQFAHFSDTHLGARQYNLAEREQDFYESFQETIDKILEERVDFVLHAGDLFEHNRPKVEALFEAQKGFLKLQKKGIPVYVIPGNHDLRVRRKVIPPQSLYQNIGVKVLGGKKRHVVLNDHNLFLGGIPYFPRYYSEQLKEDLSKIAQQAKEEYKYRILMLHQGLQSHLPYEQAYELKLTDIPKNFHYYAMGHVHRRIIENYGEGKLSFPGSADIWRADEIHDFKEKGKGFNLVDLSGDEPDIQFINIETIRHFEYYKIQVEKFQKELEKMIEKIKTITKTTPKKPMVKCVVEGKMEYDNAYYATKIKGAIDELAFHSRIEFNPEIEGVKLEKMQVFNLREILNQLWDDDESMVNFTEELFNLLKEKNIDQAVKTAEKFYQGWKNDS
ncbi:MAG: metallophosphoesterase [Candidatus Heimdallarchaeota archaeon]|nr:metallophosphoesterase [Candidatus Heimdallarchaeota archaeon]